MRLRRLDFFFFTTSKKENKKEKTRAGREVNRSYTGLLQTPSTSLGQEKLMLNPNCRLRFAV
jgi:hypothetical protein